MNRRAAVIDLGTNTFDLLIAEPHSSGWESIYQEQTGVRIGAGGIQNKIITEEAQGRLFRALEKFEGLLKLYSVAANRRWGVATSAFRNARNGQEIASEIQNRLQIPIEIISGDQEATFIYLGVRKALDLGEENALIMDIGGGSVEFIIANRRKLLWKKSFEIGGQRLMDQFQRTDPIQNLDIQRMEIYLEYQLLELSQAIFRYGPKFLVGSSGTFDTIAEIAYRREYGDQNLSDFVDENHQLLVPEYLVDADEFHYIYQSIIRNDRDTRLVVPGMIELRVDMIVVAVCLLKFILEKYEFDHMRISGYALKEGFLLSKLGQG